MSATRRLDLLPAPQARASRALRPFRAHFVVTHKCNLSCEHCYQAEHDSEDLSTEEVKDVLDQLARMGVLQLVIGGGEPMARRDFWEILEEARRLKFVVQLYTNATLINEEAKARRLRELGVAHVSVSLHGASAQSHDRFVRRAGAFDRINRAIDWLEAQGMRVVVKTTATRANKSELPKMEARFGRRPLTVLSVNHKIFSRDDGDTSPQLWRLTPEQERAVEREKLLALSREQFMEELERVRRLVEAPEKELAPCEATRSALAIMPNGDVVPCTQSASLVMGNLRQRRLEEIWLDSRVGDRFRALSKASFSEAHSECATCAFRKVCIRCAAMSFDETGQLTGHSAYLCRSTKIRWTEFRRRAEELDLDCPF